MRSDHACLIAGHTSMGTPATEDTSKDDKHCDTPERVRRTSEVRIALKPAMREVLSLPEADIRHVITALIERLDDLAGDPDLEAEEDCCDAGDDDPSAFPDAGDGASIGDAEDAEDSYDAEPEDCDDER